MAGGCLTSQVHAHQQLLRVMRTSSVSGKARGGPPAAQGGSAGNEETTAVDHCVQVDLGHDHALSSHQRVWWVPEELNLSTRATLFHSPPGYGRLSGKGPVLAVRFERTLERGLSSPPLPLGYASVVPSAGFEPALSAL